MWKEKGAFLIIVAIVFVLSCNGPPPPPPPPECGENESCQCIEGYERDNEGDCVEIPPPPPPPPVEPDDYITVARAGGLGEKCVTSTGLLRELCFNEQQLIWDGVRHPDYALGHCCDDLPGPWPITVSDCVSPEVEINREVYVELASVEKNNPGFMAKLQQVNKRCKPSHPEYKEEFCGRTNVNRHTFKAWREERLSPAILLSEQLNGIKAWCEEIN